MANVEKKKKKGPNLLDLTFTWAMATDMCKEPSKWYLFLCTMTMRHNRV